MAYEKLFEPGRIGTMVIKNRGVMAPMGSNLAGNDGNATDRQIKYYQERAKGGIGMIVNEYTGVDDVDSMPSVNYYRVARDHNLAAAEALVDAVHMYDCRIVAQLHHAGSTSNPAYTGRDNIAPSAVPIADGKPVPREMTLEDIKRVQGKFIDAAVRCHKAGYDGVELHGAHGYLLTQFFNDDSKDPIALVYASSISPFINVILPLRRLSICSIAVLIELMLPLIPPISETMPLYCSRVANVALTQSFAPLSWVST